MRLSPYHDVEDGNGEEDGNSEGGATFRSTSHVGLPSLAPGRRRFLPLCHEATRPGDISATTGASPASANIDDYIGENGGDGEGDVVNGSDEECFMDTG